MATVPNMSGFGNNRGIQTQDVVGNTGAQMAAVLEDGALSKISKWLMTSAMDGWKNKAIEKRQIAKEQRMDERQIAKEGRVLGMAEDERVREEALYADPESRESRALALEEERVRSIIDKNKASSDYSRAGAARQRKSGSKTAEKSKVPLKFSELDKQKLKDLRERQKDFEPGSKQDKVIEAQKNTIYQKYDPQYQADLARQQELLDKQGKGGPPPPAPAPKKNVDTIIGRSGVSKADIARISNKYPGKVLSKQEIAEIIQAERIEEELNKPKTLNPNLFNGGLLESMRVPR